MIGVHIRDQRYLKSSSKISRYDKKLLDNSDIIQVFVSNNDNIKPIKNYSGKYIVHASYTINLSKEWNEYSIHIIQLINEISLAYKLGALGIVVHMGKKLDLSFECAYNNMYTSLLFVHEQTRDNPILIYLETSTGQGSELCYKIEDFAHFYKKFKRHKKKSVNDRFRICLDTCHIFAAGYNLTSELSIKIYLEVFEELIGIRYINLIHLNDSKNELGSNIDRHENIGQGYIGKNALKYIAKYFHKLNIPIILETPYENILNDLKFIKKNIIPRM